jgi:ribonuclease T2
MRGSFLALLAFALPGAAHAQALQCRVPAAVPRPVLEGPTEREPSRIVPVGGYTLAVTWSPETCRLHGRDPDNRFQCGGGNRFGFTLHGLWPDGEGAQWPQYCRAAPLLSVRTIRRNLCATPSAQLLQHEYVKHGTCMGLTPDAYFARSRPLYAALHYPDMRALAARPALTAGDFTAAFARANRGMRADMLRLNVNRQGRLEEVWICHDRNLRRATCPAHQGGAAPGTRIAITPQRRGRR